MVHRPQYSPGRPKWSSTRGSGIPGPELGRPERPGDDGNKPDHRYKRFAMEKKKFIQKPHKAYSPPAWTSCVMKSLWSKLEEKKVLNNGPFAFNAQQFPRLTTQPA